MTPQRDMFQRIVRKSGRCGARLRNGQASAAAEEEDVTHLEADMRTPMLVDAAAAHGCVVCPTLGGKWWAVPACAGGLMRHVLAVCYDASSTWQPHGLFLAYLSLVVLMPSAYSRVFDAEDMEASIAWCRQIFHPKHPVWDYVFTQEKRI